MTKHPYTHEAEKGALLDAIDGGESIAPAAK
jgi:hypothetical protein